MVAFSLTGCNSNEVPEDLEPLVYELEDGTLTEGDLINQSLLAIQGNEESTLGVIISDEDIIEDASVSSYYCSKNSYYLQISSNGKHYMYRFQISDGWVESYIKYDFKE